MLKDEQNFNSTLTVSDDREDFCFHVVLVAQSIDWMGYITYIFKNLDECDIYTTYFMCTRFPNWDHRHIENGEAGYVSLRYVRANTTEWYDNDGVHKYKYSNVVFIRFVNEMSELIEDNPEEMDTEIGEGTQQ